MILNLVQNKDVLTVSYINEKKINITNINITNQDKFVWKYCKDITNNLSWDNKYVKKIKSDNLSKFRLYDIIKHNDLYDNIISAVNNINLNYITLDKKNNRIIILLNSKIIVIAEEELKSKNINTLFIPTLTFSESLQQLTNIINKIKEPFLIYSKNDYKLYNTWLEKNHKIYSDFIFCYDDIFEKYDKTIRVKDSNNVFDIHYKLLPKNLFNDNINIVEILKFKEIEDSLQLFSIMLSISNISKCPLKRCNSSIEIAESFLYEYFYYKNKILPNKNKKEFKEESYTGGFTEIYEKGKHDLVLYLDFSGTYPSIIKQFNISPENYVSNNKINTLCSGIKFDNNPNTSLPEIYTKLIDKRNKIIILKNNEENINKKQFLSSYEKSIKECSNALYGCFGNHYFYFSCIDIAKTITMQVRDVLQYTILEFNKKLNLLLKSNANYVLYNDTDSIMVNCELLSKKTDKWKELISKLSTNILNDYSTKWNTNNYLNLKIENEFKKLFLVSKKRYFYIDKDNLFGVTGMKSIHSTTCKFLQEKLNILLKDILDNDIDKRYIIDFCKKNKKLFVNEKIENISETYKVNRYNEFVIDDLSEITIKDNTPNEILSCAIYNHLIYKNKLTDKYKLIQDGDKIRWYHTNNTNLPYFAYFPKKYPYELALQIDYDKQYDAAFFNILNQTINTIGIDHIQKSELIF